MSIKDKNMNIVTAYPILVTFGIGLAVTFVVGTVIGLADHQYVFAIGSTVNGSGRHC